MVLLEDNLEPPIADPVLMDLRRAVLRDPEDDTPRLVYADRLDELGGAVHEARARFVRLGIELHRAPPCRVFTDIAWGEAEPPGCGCVHCTRGREYDDFFHQPDDFVPPPAWQAGQWWGGKLGHALDFAARWRRGFVYDMAVTCRDQHVLRLRLPVACAIHPVESFNPLGFRPANFVPHVSGVYPGRYQPSRTGDAQPGVGEWHWVRAPLRPGTAAAELAHPSRLNEAPRYCRVPDFLFDRLAAAPLLVNFARYPNTAAAYVDLGAAYLKYGRARQGVPA